MHVKEFNRITKKQNKAISILDCTQEARRNIEICNSCRYCEGFCAVFPAIQNQRKFDDRYIDYLSNLCHNCTSCYHACQFTTPHVYDINVPKILTQVRTGTYQKYLWPQSFSNVLKHNGTFVALITVLFVVLILLISVSVTDSDVLFSVHRGEGAFYKVISHKSMIYVAGSIFLAVIFSLTKGVVKYWEAIGGKKEYLLNISAIRKTFKSALTLKYLGGGDDEKGCNEESARFTNRRRILHHLMMYGFLLCFAATVSGTIFHYGFGWEAPYSYMSLPVILGTIGGVMTVIGTAGLIWVKLNMHEGPIWKNVFGMDYAFLVLLFWVNLTGLVLLFFRETTAMGLLLIIHLGFVAAFFSILPYSKFIHVFFRLSSLLKYYNEIDNKKQS